MKKQLNNDGQRTLMTQFTLGVFVDLLAKETGMPIAEVASLLAASAELAEDKISQVPGIELDQKNIDAGKELMQKTAEFIVTSKEEAERIESEMAGQTTTAHTAPGEETFNKAKALEMLRNSPELEQIKDTIKQMVGSNPEAAAGLVEQLKSQGLLQIITAGLPFEISEEEIVAEILR